ncbi:hypothetical protein B0I35DRAFT_421942 [Stachybotrys elegans]|uniref:rRNA methyltransferase 1, mitochondrial n=1 Tax=Stachybotrys elegans TaxID=80388 RepID=A0A8K0WUY9_9HYPO|nr:hypothetical protein B0I35DRAFT_421942 [Stachybotrys elegans]
MVFTRNLASLSLQRPLYTNTITRSLTPFTTTRSSSLSAIHRGVQRSQRAVSGSRRPLERSSGRGRKNHGDNDPTRRALMNTETMRQQFKLLKKLDRKKVEKEEEKASGRQTRRKRFLDPDSDFGKQSLVYQLKYGKLRDVAASVDVPEPVRPLPYRSLGGKPDDKPAGHSRRRGAGERTNYPDRRDSGGRAPYRERPDSSPRTSRDSRGYSPRAEYQDRRGSSMRTGYQDRRDTEQGAQWSRSNSSSERRPQEVKDHNDEDPDESARRTTKKKVMMPMNIKYTTAASQFLYGKSVVQAALQQSRRKLYNLYIHGGESRKDSKEHALMTRLAKMQNVPVTIIHKDDQRLMDKMSLGRPHNGFVLEASPLPKLPITALGKFQINGGRPGFHVELDYQSKEEEAINGQETFMQKLNNLDKKPFVLLLNEIVDPGNLGALLRTASYLGADAVGITNRSSSTLTPVVLKSAAGAVEELTIFTVDSPVSFIEKSRAAGWKAYAAVAPPEDKLAEKHGDKFISTDDLERMRPLENHPTILLLGNEGFGLPRALKVASDYELSVPRFVATSSVDSLNVSVAAGLLCHSFVKAAVGPAKDGAQDNKAVAGNVLF